MHSSNTVPHEDKSPEQPTMHPTNTTEGNITHYNKALFSDNPLWFTSAESEFSQITSLFYSDFDSYLSFISLLLASILAGNLAWLVLKLAWPADSLALMFYFVVVSYLAFVMLLIFVFIKNILLWNIPACCNQSADIIPGLLLPCSLSNFSLLNLDWISKCICQPFHIAIQFLIFHIIFYHSCHMVTN